MQLQCACIRSPCRFTIEVIRSSITAQDDCHLSCLYCQDNRFTTHVCHNDSDLVQTKTLIDCIESGALKTAALK